MASPGDGNGRSGLFHRMRFWISQHVPQRTKFRELIEKHGGQVVLLDKDADVKLVDHTKKTIPSDNYYSYKYVERSVLNGRLEDLEAHRAGPSAPRPMGASHIPRKGTRSDYSLRDDQILFDWLHPLEKEMGAPINGNKIYQEIAVQCPRHSWQSWRARYLKKLRGRPRPGGGAPLPRSEWFPDDSAQERSPQQPAPEPSRVPEPRGPRAPSPQPPKPAELKRKRDSVPEDVSSSKRKAIELPQPAENNSSHPHSEGGESRPQPTNLSTTPVKTGQRPAERPTGSATRSAPAPGQKESSEPPINQADDMVDPVFLELPFLPPSPEPAQDDEEAEQSETSDVDAWIDARLARGNVDESSVIDALRCTSMDPTLADKVLEHFLAGQAVPDNIPGIWTAEDDECLEGQNMRDVERVLTKHGSGACEARWDYLSMARERGLV